MHLYTQIQGAWDKAPPEGITSEQLEKRAISIVGLTFLGVCEIAMLPFIGQSILCNQIGPDDDELFSPLTSSSQN